MRIIEKRIQGRVHRYIRFKVYELIDLVKSTKSAIKDFKEKALSARNNTQNQIEQLGSNISNVSKDDLKNYAFSYAYNQVKPYIGPILAIIQTSDIYKKIAKVYKTAKPIVEIIARASGTLFSPGNIQEIVNISLGIIQKLLIQLAIEAFNKLKAFVLNLDIDIPIGSIAIRETIEKGQEEVTQRGQEEDPTGIDIISDELNIGSGTAGSDNFENKSIYDITDITNYNFIKECEGIYYYGSNKNLGILIRKENEDIPKVTQINTGNFYCFAHILYDESKPELVIVGSSSSSIENDAGEQVNVNSNGIWYTFDKGITWKKAELSLLNDTIINNPSCKQDIDYGLFASNEYILKDGYSVNDSGEINRFKEKISKDVIININTDFDNEKLFYGTINKDNQTLSFKESDVILTKKAEIEDFPSMETEQLYFQINYDNYIFKADKQAEKLQIYTKYDEEEILEHEISGKYISCYFKEFDDESKNLFFINDNNELFYLDWISEEKEVDGETEIINIPKLTNINLTSDETSTITNLRFVLSDGILFVAFEENSVDDVKRIFKVLNDEGNFDFILLSENFSIEENNTFGAISIKNDYLKG